MVIVIANDIQKIIRGDLGITYDSDVLRLIDANRQYGLHVGSVVIAGTPGRRMPPTLRQAH